jgi:hypothetical protein
MRPAGCTGTSPAAAGIENPQAKQEQRAGHRGNEDFFHASSLPIPERSRQFPACRKSRRAAWELRRFSPDGTAGGAFERRAVDGAGTQDFDGAGRDLDHGAGRADRDGARIQRQRHVRRERVPGSAAVFAAGAPLRFALVTAGTMPSKARSHASATG